MSIRSSNLGNEIGRGAFGVVYEYSDTILQRKDVVKRICFEEVLIQHPWTSIKKILQEVDNSKEVIHKNVVQYIDSWLEGPDISKIVVDNFDPPELSSSSYALIPRNNFLNIRMELCDTSLEKIIALHAKDGNGLNISQLLGKYVDHSPQQIFLQLCQGLEAIHAADIIHRDLQPGNIFLKEGIWKIGDFGLSRKEGEDKSADRGTRIFHSPEMYRGEKDYTFDTDIYSLGLILLLILNRSLQTNKFFMKGVFHELKVAKDPSEALVEAGKDVEDEYSIELSTIKKMIVSNRQNRIPLQRVIKLLSNADRIGELTRNLCPDFSPKGRHEKYVYPGSLTLPENHDGFFGKRADMAETLTALQNSIDKNMTNSLKEQNANIKIIFVGGQPSTGKSYFVKNCLSLLKDCNLVWIDCVEIMEGYKSFLRKAKDEIGSKSLEPWLIVFDELDQKSLACFTIIMKALFGNLCIFTRPACIITTSSVLEESRITNIFGACAEEWGHGDTQHFCKDLFPCPLVPPTFTTTTYSMDYFWINEMLEAQPGLMDLRKLMYCIFKRHSQNGNIDPQDDHMINRICESFGAINGISSISSSKEKLRLSFVLIYLLVEGNEAPDFPVFKADFYHCWGIFAGNFPTFMMLDAVLQAFISQGVINSVALDETKTFQFNEDGILYQNAVLSFPCRELFQTILKHPISVHIFQNVLGLEEFHLFRKLLEYLKQNDESNLGRTFFKQVQLMKKWGQRMAPNYEALLCEYPSQLHACVQDIMEFQLMVELHSKCCEKFGHFQPATIKFGASILNHAWFEKISPSQLANILGILNGQIKAFENIEKISADPKFIVESCNLVFFEWEKKIMRLLVEEPQPEMAIAYGKLLNCIGSILEKFQEYKKAWGVYSALVNFTSPEPQPALEDLKPTARIKMAKLKYFLTFEEIMEINGIKV